MKYNKGNKNLTFVKGISLSKYLNKIWEFTFVKGILLSKYLNKIWENVHVLFMKSNYNEEMKCTELARQGG